MAILINGNGNPAIYPDQDADWFASIFGGQTAITGVGSQFAAEIQDANTIALADGVIITKEGRRIQLDANQSDIFEIPTGAQGTTNYYIIGYCLTTNDDSSQTAETFVQLMENATDTIEEDTFRDGADKVYVSLYRVTQTGFNLETPELLLPTVESITQLNADLTDNGEKFKFGYDSANDEMGYYKKVDGADTFFPFKSPSGELIITEAGTYDVTNYASAIVAKRLQKSASKSIPLYGTYETPIVVSFTSAEFPNAILDFEDIRVSGSYCSITRSVKDTANKQCTVYVHNASDVYQNATAFVTAVGY